MRNLVEAPKPRPTKRDIARIPTRTAPSGLLVAEGPLQDPGINGLPNPAASRSFKTVEGSGLLVPEKKPTGPFDFVVMTDFGGNSTRTDLANAEVELNVRSIAKDHNVGVGAVTVSPLEGFSTINTGFATAQLAVHKNHGGIDRVFYVNTNPRLDPDDERSWTDDDNFGRLAYVKLKNGARVFTVNSKYNLSFLKEHIDEAWVVRTDRNDQFLSRAIFAESAMAVLAGDTSYLERPLDVETITYPPEGHLVAQDGNGNLKTSWRIGDLRRHNEIAESPNLAVTINGKTYIARNNLVTKGGNTGELTVQGGSSGYYDRRPPTDDQLVEVVVLYGAANKAFGVEVIKDNTRVDIQPTSETQIHRVAA